MNSIPVVPCSCALHVQPTQLFWGVWRKLFHHHLIQTPTIQRNSPLSPRIHGQRKTTLPAWIPDNKGTFFGLKRNPSRVILWFWASVMLPWDRTCSWLPNSVEYLWLLGGRSRSGEQEWIARYIAEQNKPTENNKCQETFWDNLAELYSSVWDMKMFPFIKKSNCSNH